MVDGAGMPGEPSREEWEELEPQRVWTKADRWRLAAWVLVFGLLLAVLIVAPIGDAVLERSAEAAGTDGATARLTYWIALLGGTLLGAAIGAAGAATKQRWAIVPPVAGAIICALALPISLQLI